MLRTMSKWLVWLVVLAGCGSVQTETRGTEPPTTMRTPTTVPVTSVPITIAPETTTTTTVPPFTLDDLRVAIDEARAKWGKCGEFHDLAMTVGWQEEHWQTLSRVLWTESRCRNLIPMEYGGTADDAKWFNGHDWGPTQINRPVHRDYVEEIFGEPFEIAMSDPVKNLRFAYILYSGREAQGKCGWKPWTEPC